MIQTMAAQAFESAVQLMNKEQLDCGFELFGLDFMIDDSLHLYLIEFNTNPCLSVTSPVTGAIIPKLLEDTFRLAVDPLYPPLPHQAAKFISTSKPHGSSRTTTGWQLIYSAV